MYGLTFTTNLKDLLLQPLLKYQNCRTDTHYDYTNLVVDVQLFPTHMHGLMFDL